MRLLVAGCSVSDYTQITNVWGETTAEILGVQYIHRAGGGGSNCRAYREIVNAVLDGVINSGDRVIWQVTEPIRTELPSAFLTSFERSSDYFELMIEQGKGDELSKKQKFLHERLKNQKINSKEKPAMIDFLHDNSCATRWKIDSYTYQDYQNVEFHSAYQSQVTEALGQEKTRAYVETLRPFLRNKGIKFHILWEGVGNSFRGYWRDNFDLDYSTDDDLILTEIWPPYGDWRNESNFKYRLTPNDVTHFSALGMEKVGTAVAKEIQKRET